MDAVGQNPNSYVILLCKLDDAPVSFDTVALEVFCGKFEEKFTSGIHFDLTAFHNGRLELICPRSPPNPRSPRSSPLKRS